MNFIQSVRDNARGVQIFRGGIGSVNGPNYGSVVQINGTSISGSIIGNSSLGSTQGWEITEAAKLKVVALDAHGNEIDSFKLPVGTQLTLHVTAPTIDSIKATTADVRVEQVESIGKINISTGSVQIDKATTINSVNASMGSIKVLDCGEVGSANASMGSVQINERRRDSSPKRNKRASSPSKTIRPSAKEGEVVTMHGKPVTVHRMREGAARKCPACGLGAWIKVGETPGLYHCVCGKDLLVKYD